MGFVKPVLCEMAASILQVLAGYQHDSDYALEFGFPAFIEAFCQRVLPTYPLFLKAEICEITTQTADKADITNICPCSTDFNIRIVSNILAVGHALLCHDERDKATARFDYVYWRPAYPFDQASRLQQLQIVALMVLLQDINVHSQANIHFALSHAISRINCETGQTLLRAWGALQLAFDSISLQARRLLPCLPWPDHQYLITEMGEPPAMRFLENVYCVRLHSSHRYDGDLNMDWIDVKRCYLHQIIEYLPSFCYYHAQQRSPESLQGDSETLVRAELCTNKMVQYIEIQQKMQSLHRYVSLRNELFLIDQLITAAQLRLCEYKVPYEMLIRHMDFLENYPLSYNTSTMHWKSLQSTVAFLYRASLLRHEVDISEDTSLQ